MTGWLRPGGTGLGWREDRGPYVLLLNSLGTDLRLSDCVLAVVAVWPGSLMTQGPAARMPDRFVELVHTFIQEPVHA